MMRCKPFSRQELEDCARRELVMRRRVYPGLVSRGRMTDEQARREIAMMEAIVRDYEPAPRPDLFAGEY